MARALCAAADSGSISSARSAALLTFNCGIDRLRNLALVPSTSEHAPIALSSEREAPAGALAFAFGRDTIAPGETTQAFLVFAKGGLE